MLAIGIMSGTSLDGVDVALVDIKEKNNVYQGYDLEESIYFPFDETTKNKILECSKLDTSNVQKICSLNFEISEIYVQAIELLFKNSRYKIDDIEFIAIHGQTIWHNPISTQEYVSSTLQIGEPSVIAYHFNKTVISNFRSMDISAGGCGAPLMPFAHYLMYKSLNKNMAIINIGGISNITYLPSNGCQEEVFAFDCGPGNMLIDGAMKKLYQLPFDENGSIASSGKVINDVLEKLLKDEYFLKPYPKSTGREKYSEEFLNDLIDECFSRGVNKEDIITTLTAFTAEAIIDQYHRFLPVVDKIILAGGGINNHYLFNYLKTKLKTKIEKSSNGDMLEAIGFALLGYATIRRIPSNIIKVTGAKKSVVLGNITYPPLKEKSDE